MMDDDGDHEGQDVVAAGHSGTGSAAANRMERERRGAEKLSQEERVSELLAREAIEDVPRSHRVRTTRAMYPMLSIPVNRHESSGETVRQQTPLALPILSNRTK
jgi:hypothetical protein